MDEKGVVTAVSAGKTTITITAHNGQQAKTIIIVEIPVQKVELNQTEMVLYMGDSQILAATILPDDATHQTVTWESDNTEIATVDEGGMVTAVAVGETSITATSQNGVSTSCTLNVIERTSGTSGTGGTGASGTSTNVTTGGNDAGNGGDSGGAGGGTGGGNTTPTSSPLTNEQIQQAINEASGYAQSLGFTIVGDRQPGHSIASVAYYDYGAFLQNLKDNVSYVASLFDAGDDLSLVKMCFVREGNSVYVTYG